MVDNRLKIVDLAHNPLRSRYFSLLTLYSLSIYLGYNRNLRDITYYSTVTRKATVSLGILKNTIQSGI